MRINMSKEEISTMIYAFCTIVFVFLFGRFCLGASSDLDPYRGTITSYEGEFVVVDKYTEDGPIFGLLKDTVYKVVLEDPSGMRYTMEATEKAYTKLDIQEKIFIKISLNEELKIHDGLWALE